MWLCRAMWLCGYVEKDGQSCVRARACVRVYVRVDVLHVLACVLACVFDGRLLSDLLVID